MPLPHVDRRRFLQVSGGAAALTALPESIARAASIPAHRATGSIKDVEHVVILIQENRSFDHYYGTMRGVRGFSDPHPARLPNGKSVFHQAAGSGKDAVETLPFRPDMDDLGMAFIQDLDHGWNGTHEAFAEGRFDDWIASKSTTSMAHLTRRDMPFHYALADAFTICDSYHCGLLGPTDPNRYYAWTGWVGNDGKGGGPVIGNDEIGYSWSTYPERLEKAGVSWKIYQDVGLGLDANNSYGYAADAYIGNYGDNALLYFKNYQTALPGSALYEKALTGTRAMTGDGFFDILTADVKADKLPQVSWIVAPEAFSEHPNWPVNYGAWYTSGVLDALTSNPEVWSKTALFITYDENDGFFDHVVPPYAATAGLPGSSTVTTANERYVSGSGTTTGASSGDTGNFGMGIRVPMMVVSPWSTGGLVCSETFDHTSMLRFLEKRFGVHEPNITAWRRTVAGDLTSAFDFSKTKQRFPTLPSTTSYKPKDSMRHTDYVPVPPKHGAVPTQEKGGKLSRPLGYHLDATALLPAPHRELQVHLSNKGTLGAAFQIRSGADMWSHTVGAGKQVTALVPVSGAYDVELHGPDGFYRRFVDRHVEAQRAKVEVSRSVASATGVELTVVNHGTQLRRVSLRDDHTRKIKRYTLRPGQKRTVTVPVAATHGWYDFTLTAAGLVRTFAGRVHTGKVGRSDPRLG